MTRQPCLPPRVFSAVLDHIEERVHRIRLLQPAERLGGCGPPPRLRIGMRGREDAANAMVAKQFESRIDAVALAREAYIHQYESGALFDGERDRLFGGSRDADEIEACFGQGFFDLHGDEEVVFDDHDPRRLRWPFSRSEGLVLCSVKARKPGWQGALLDAIGPLHDEETSSCKMSMHDA